MLWDTTHTFPDGYVLQAYLNLMNFALLRFTITFYKLKVCGNLVLSDDD